MTHEITHANITIAVAEDGTTIDAYMARPTKDGQYPAIIIGMELFGLHPHIKDVTERVAKLGYIAIAPNFYHRTLPKEYMPFGDEGRKRGFEHLHQLTRTHVINDTRAILDYIKADKQAKPDVGFLGFSFGGHIAYLATTQFNIKACACLYAGWLTNTDIPLSQPEPTITLTREITKHNGRIIYFAGGADHAVTQEQLQQIESALKKANVRHEMVVYPGITHGFFCDQRDTFDAASRDDAWNRVQQLFKEEL